MCITYAMLLCRRRLNRRAAVASLQAMSAVNSREAAAPAVSMADGSARPSGPQTTLLVLVLIVGAAVMLVHWPATTARVLSFDDGQYLLENRLVRNPSWDSVLTFFREWDAPSTVEGYYQPLSMTSLMLDVALGGRPDNLRPFHITSLVLHVLNSVLIVVVLYLLFGNVWIAAAVGLLFGVHPLTVEPIPWIGERKTLLAGLFVFSCLACYVLYARRRDRWLYAAALGLFVLALLSKPTSTPLPVLLLLLDYWPLRRLRVGVLLEKLPFFVLAGLAAWVTFVSQAATATVKMPGERGLLTLLFTICHNIVFYLYQIVWPANLTSHHPFPDPFDMTHPMVCAGVIGMVVLVVGLLAVWRWTRAPLTGWLIFFVAIFPTLGVIGFTNVVVSDKFVYVPGLGLLMVLAWALARGWDALGPPRQLTAGRVGVLVVLLLAAGAEAVGTRRHLARWQDTETLYRYMLTLAPDAEPLHRHLGLEMLKQGRTDEALVFLRKAAELDPSDYFVRNNMGATLADVGMQLESEARALYQEGRALIAQELVDDAKIKMDRSQELAGEAQAKYAEAAEQFRASIHLRPGDAWGYSNLGRVLGRMGRPDEAIEQLEKAKAVDPTAADVYVALATLQAQQREFGDAAANYRQAITVDRSFVNAYIGLGLCLIDLREPDEAVRVLEEAERIEPGNSKVKAVLERARRVAGGGA